MTTLLRPNARKSRRSGTTLVELIALMGFLVVIATASYRSLNHLTAITYETKQANYIRGEVRRFNARLRADAELATGVDGSDDSLTLACDRQTAGVESIKYKFDKDELFVSRITMVGGEQKSIDQFELPPKSNLSVSVQESSFRIEIDLASEKNLKADSELENQGLPQANWIIETGISGESE